jgi:Na+-translocating ferredoxin:NAD+ oxidoreductase RnfD subunit
VAITVFNILGHTYFGFEQSIAQPLVALATAYSLELFFELLDAWKNNRRPNFIGSFTNFVDFLLSAHITALAVAMLIYPNERFWPVIFATATAISSKALLRARVGSSPRHFFNPSNFGITLTLLFFPWVGIAQPYHFTENLDGFGDWVIPGIIVVSGTFLNARFTKKLPLIAGWLGGFIIQAALRNMIFGTAITGSLLPMTGVAFILYTFYMVTDPATTPSGARAQALFGASVAAVYGALIVTHIVFGLFFSLTIVCTLRGLGLYVNSLAAQRASVKRTAQAALQDGAMAREV